MKRCISCLIGICLSLALLCGCGNSSEVLMKIGGHNVTYDEYRYCYVNNARDNTDASADELKEMTLDVILSSCAVRELASSYDVSLSKDEKEAIDEKMEEYEKQYGSSEAFETALDEMGATRDVLWSTIESNSLRNKLYNYVTSEENGVITADDATLTSDIEKNFLRASQILIKKDDSDTTGEKKALAESLLLRLRGGEDFDSLCAEYSEDEATKNSPDGYYFTHGQLISEFEDAAASLQVGEISEVVESSIGYHIIMRRELEEEYINENIEELRDCYVSRIFSEMLETCRGGLEVKYTENYYALDPEKLK